MKQNRFREVTDGPLTLLRPEDARRLTTDAWRYIWQRNPVVASRLWRKYHPNEAVPVGCALVDIREAA